MTAAPPIITQNYDTYEHRNCAALKWDETMARWEGNLHFRAGTLRVWIEVNPIAHQDKQPTLRIRQIKDNVNIGCLFRHSDGTYCGRLDTAVPLPLFAIENKAGGRFVIKRRHGVHLKSVSRRPPVVLVLEAYPEGERYHGK